MVKLRRMDLASDTKRCHVAPVDGDLRSDPCICHRFGSKMADAADVDAELGVAVVVAHVDHQATLDVL